MGEGDASGRRVGWRTVVAAFLAGAAAAALIAGAVVLIRGDTGDDRLTFSSTEIPGEYLYLDRERVLSYLAQIQGGEVGAETRSSARERSGKVLVDTGTALGGEGGLRFEETATRVVTPTDASNFLQLLDKLDDPRLQRPVRLREIDAAADPVAFAGSLMELREGDFVTIRGARVLMPIYAQPYDAIKRFGSLEIGGSAADLRTVQRIARVARRAANLYARRIGPNPRIAVNLGARGGEDGPPFGRRFLRVIRHGGRAGKEKVVTFGGCPLDVTCGGVSTACDGPGRTS